MCKIQIFYQHVLNALCDSTSKLIGLKLMVYKYADVLHIHTLCNFPIWFTDVVNGCNDYSPLLAQYSSSSP